MQPDENTKVVRQIILNRKLEALASEDCPDGMCKSYMYYVQRNKIAEEATWAEDIQEFDPFLEILILSERSESGEPDLLPNFSFMVSFISSDQLDKSQWRLIRDKVKEHLGKFERERAYAKRKLFSLTGKDALASAPKIALEILILSDRQALDELVDMLNLSGDDPDPLPGLSSDETDPSLDLPSKKRYFLLNLSFMVSFISSYELNIEQWRKIRNVVHKYLEDFELKYFTMEGRLFYPEDKDLSEAGQKTAKTGAKLRVALELYDEYIKLKKEIRENRKSEIYLKGLSTQYSVSMKEIRAILSPHPAGLPYSKRTRPAELAKELILRTQLAKDCSIKELQILESEVLHRRPNSFLRKRKRQTTLKRPIVYVIHSEPAQLDNDAMSYNIQGLRLTKLTVEKVWKGHIE